MTTITKESNEKNTGNAVLSLFRNNRFLQLCAFVLIVQLAAAALLSTSNKQATFAGGKPIFDLAQDDINSIAIDNGDESIDLKKQDGGWQIQHELALPADPALISTLLSSLTGLKTGLPVASSVNAREQMEVADDNYQRKLVVNGEEANTYLLGTSPGLRKSHLRPQDSDDIFSSSLPVSDMPTTINQWLDKSLLAMNDIEQITSDAISFKRVGSGDDVSWEAQPNEDKSTVLDEEKLKTSVTALENLRVSGLSDSSLASSSGEDSDKQADNSSETNAKESEEAETDAIESVELVVTSAKNELTLKLEKRGDKSTAHRSDIDQLFSISASTFDSISALANADGWFTDVGKETDVEEDTSSKE